MTFGRTDCYQRLSAAFEIGKDDRAGKRVCSVIENRTEAMRQLTEELFSYSVVTTASQYRKEEEVLLGEILEDSIASMYGALVEKNIHLEVRMPEKKIRVKANRSGLCACLEILSIMR